MILELPIIPSVPWYRFTTTLEQTQYIIDVRWNERDASWYLDLAEIDETPILSGARLVLGVAIGRRSAHPLFGKGQLVASDTTGAGRDAGLDDLGTRIKLRWIPVADLIKMALAS